MKLAKILMLASLCLVLPACGGLTKSVKVPIATRPHIARADSALLKECDLPINLGDNPIAQAQLEKLWITDRKRLLECYRKHLALRNFVVDRDDALRGDP